MPAIHVLSPSSLASSSSSNGPSDCFAERVLSLLIVRSGDVEMNPGPPKARSEVLRNFMRFVQTDLVHLIYKKKEVAIPTPLYDQEPPGWSTIDRDIKFENICNIQSGGSRIFDKLIKLCRKIGVIPKDYIDVIISYEQLRDSRKKTDEAEKSKTTLENFMSRRKSLKNKEAVLENLDEEYITMILQKATELLKQGAIGSAEGICKMFDAAKDFVIALEEGGGKLVIMLSNDTPVVQLLDEFNYCMFCCMMNLLNLVC